MVVGSLFGLEFGSVFRIVFELELGSVFWMVVGKIVGRIGSGLRFRPMLEPEIGFVLIGAWFG